jgi:hypothetical protein
MSNRLSRINLSWRPLIAACAVFGLSLAPAGSAAIAAAATPPNIAVVYNPTGSQCSCNSLTPAFVAAGFSATDISQVGMLGGGGNTDVWPVGQVGPSKGANLTPYVSITVTPSSPAKFETLTYSKQSYMGQGPRNASVRTSLDGFAADVASVSGLNPAGFDQITFNLGSLPITSSKVEFRIYFLNAPGQDWADLVSTNRGGAGLILIGELAPTNATPTPTPVTTYDLTQAQPTQTP